MALNYNKKGSVDYTVVGTPTIVDGVASGFSDNDYLQLTSQFDITKDFEAVFNVETGPADTISNYQRIWSYDCNGTNGIWINNRVLYWSIAGNNIAILNNGDYSISGNTNYLIRARHINGVYYLDHSIDNGTTWRGETSQTFSHTGSITQANTYLGNGASYPHAWLGSIDLNQTYIKVNGQAWFGVCPVEVKHIDYGTSVGYTLVGSPTINNGVVSGFSDSNYLKVDGSFSEQGDIDIIVKITTDNDLNTGQYPLSWNCNTVGPRTSGLYIISGGNYGMVGRTVTDEGFQYTAGSTYALSANTAYYLRLLFTVADKSLKIGASTDGENYTYGISQTLTANLCPMNGNSIRIGRAQPNNYSFLGSVDLNGTSIQVNNKLWFYRPVTNYLIKDGKLVFADSNVYIDDNGTKTYASANIAPVPSGFTYGTTTTTDVGLVDMTTQAFTAVPGATWGKD